MEVVFCLDGCNKLLNLNMTGVTSDTTGDIDLVRRQTRVFNMMMGMCMIFFGLPGSILCAMITYRNSSKQSSVTALLVVNSVSSLAFLLLCLPLFFISCYNNLVVPWPGCKIYGWVLSTINCVNIWSLIMLLVIRFLTVVWPHRLFTRALGQKGIKSVVILIVISATYCLRYPFYTWDNNCGIDRKRTTIALVYVVIEFFIPVLVIWVMSILMLAIMRSTERTLVNTVAYHRSALFVEIAVLNGVWIFISTMPAIIYFAFPILSRMTSYDAEESWTLAREFISEVIVLDMFYLRHAFDIFIYISCSRRFRSELVQMTHLNKCFFITKVQPMVNLNTDGEGTVMNTPETSREIKLQTFSETRSRVKRANPDLVACVQQHQQQDAGSKPVRSPVPNISQKSDEV